MAIWDHCLRVSAEDQCSSKCEVGCTVMDTDAKVKYNVVVPHNILKEVVPVSLKEKIMFAKLLLKGTYTFKINTQSNAVLTFSSDCAIKWTLTSNFRYFLFLFRYWDCSWKKSYSSVEKIPEKSARENLVKLKAQCLQIYLFQVNVPFLYLLKTSGCIERKHCLKWVKILH